MWWYKTVKVLRVLKNSKKCGVQCTPPASNGLVVFLFWDLGSRLLLYSSAFLKRSDFWQLIGTHNLTPTPSRTLLHNLIKSVAITEPVYCPLPTYTAQDFIHTSTSAVTMIITAARAWMRVLNFSKTKDQKQRGTWPRGLFARGEKR